MFTFSFAIRKKKIPYSLHVEFKHILYDAHFLFLIVWFPFKFQRIAHHVRLQKTAPPQGSDYLCVNCIPIQLHVHSNNAQSAARKFGKFWTIFRHCWWWSIWRSFVSEHSEFRNLCLLERYPMSICKFRWGANSDVPFRIERWSRHQCAIPTWRLFRKRNRQNNNQWAQEKREPGVRGSGGQHWFVHGGSGQASGQTRGSCRGNPTDCETFGDSPPAQQRHRSRDDRAQRNRQHARWGCLCSDSWTFWLEPRRQQR